MKILLYGLNYAPEITGIGKYSGELGEWLQTNRGHDVSAVTAQPYYPDWKIADGRKNFFSKEEIAGVEVYRCPLYIPRKPSTFKRILHLVSFVFTSVFWLIYLIRWRPAVVVNVIPAMFSTLPALLYCKVTGAKLIIHVQDFESDAMFSLGMAKQSRALRVWTVIERFCLRRADKVSTISKAMMSNAVSKGVLEEDVLFFPNWSEIERFHQVENVGEFRQSMGFSDQDIIVLYSGNLGKKQGLEVVVEAAKLASEKYKSLRFLICGEGVAKVTLVTLASQLNLNNVYFEPLQPIENLPQLLAMADVHLVIQNPSVADAVLPSKLTNILAVGGNAVITTESDSEIGRLVKGFEGIATAVVPQDESALLNGIMQANKKPIPNLVARKYAIAHIAKEKVLSDFEQNMLKLVAA